MARSSKVRELFQEALDRSPDEREALFVDVPEDVRIEVEGLLAALDDASGFMAERRFSEEKAGTVFDRYKLIEPLGEGGFGVVWRAEQSEPIQRDVALKVIKLGMDTRQVTARFEAERQALARMDHPNIASVFDAGTTPAGRPYFVMEIVRGEPITTYCKDRGLGVRERVLLIRQVCLAVQHAHQKGVVHRDLKPGNILVTQQDDVGIPKVIDFGVAKAIHAPSDQQTLLTGVGQIMGTLEYMAPEQAMGSEADVDSRADVYGLGVVLYELLTGRRPFDSRDDPVGGMSALLERIKNVSPARPSTRVASADQFEVLPGADRSRWARRLRGDLDWIAQKALEKDPARRYPTPNSLAEDLQRFLEGRPVKAGPPTARYRFRRLVHRHRTAAWASVLLVSSLVAGIVATSLALDEAQQAYAEARDETDRAVQSLSVLHGLIASMDPTVHQRADYTVVQMLGDFEHRLDPDLRADVLADIALTLGAAFRGLSVLDRADHWLSRAVVLNRELYGEDDQRYISALSEKAWGLRASGKYAESEAAILTCLAWYRQLDPSGLGVSRMLQTLSDLRRIAGDPEQGAELALESLGLLRKYPGHSEGRAALLDLLADFARQRGEFEHAKKHCKAAYELRKSVSGDASPMLTNSLSVLARIAISEGEFELAESYAKEAQSIDRGAFGENHPAVARSLSLLSDIANIQGQLDRAEDYAEQALKIRRSSLPEGDVEIAVSLFDLGISSMKRNKMADAERYLQEAVLIRRKAEPTPKRDLVAALHNLGIALQRQDRPQEAEPVFREAVVLFRESSRASAVVVGDAMFNLGLSISAQGRAAEAISVHKRALAHRLEFHSDDLRRLSASYRHLADAFRATRVPGKAGANYAKLAELYVSLGEPLARVISTRARAGRMLVDAKEYEQASPLLEAAHAWCIETVPDQWPRGDSASMLSACRVAEGRWDEAVDLATEGWKLLETSGAPEKNRKAALARLIGAYQGRADSATAHEGDGLTAATYRRQLEAWNGDER